MDDTDDTRDDDLVSLSRAALIAMAAANASFLIGAGSAACARER